MDRQTYKKAQAEQQISPQLVWETLLSIIDEDMQQSIADALGNEPDSLPETTTVSEATKERATIVSWLASQSPDEKPVDDGLDFSWGQESLAESKDKDLSSQEGFHQYSDQRKPAPSKSKGAHSPRQAHNWRKSGFARVSVLNREQPGAPWIIFIGTLADILAYQLLRQLKRIYPLFPVRFGLSASQDAYLLHVFRSLATSLLRADAILSQRHPISRFSLEYIIKYSVEYLAWCIVQGRKQLQEKGPAKDKDGSHRRLIFSHILKLTGYGVDDYDKSHASASRSGSMNRIRKNNWSAPSSLLNTSDPPRTPRSVYVPPSIRSTSKSRKDLLQDALYEDTIWHLKDIIWERLNPLLKLRQFRDLIHECHVKWYLYISTSALLMNKGFTLHADNIGRVEGRPWLSIYVLADWDPFTIMRQLQEMGECCSLANVLTVTGNSQISYAASCKDYISHTWPRIGLRFLRQIDNVIKRAWEYHCAGHQGDLGHCFGIEIGSNKSLDRLCQIELKAPMSSITLKSSASELESILQMLSWLSATLRVPEQSDGPELVDLEIDGSRHCWTKFLDRAMVAQGFPIPDRGLGRGLEVSLRTAYRILGATKAIDYAGGLVIKGLYGMLLPVRFIEEGIQWHLLVTEPWRPSRSVLQELKDYPSRLTYAKTAPEIMKAISTSLADPATRCFIGWHPKAASFAGADPAIVNYSAIRKSGLRSPGQSFQFRNITLGFQQVVTAEMEMGVVPIQSTLYLRRRHHWLDDMLIQAASGRVLLYDVPTQRGWLLRTDEVMLHLLRYQLLPHHGIKLDTCDSVQETLKANIAKTVQEGLTIQDIIVDKLEVIERLQAELSNLDKGRYFSTKLFGFDFLECANRSGSFVLRESTVSGMLISRPWVQFIHASETPVLFGGGFGELIGLNKIDQVTTCSMWRKVPCNMHLMATTAQMMRQLYAEEPASTTDEGRSLTHLKLLWDQGSSMLHESCQEPCSGCCCQRVQMLRTRGLLRKKQIKGPASLPETGAIIFGDPDKVKVDPKTTDAPAVWQTRVLSGDRRQHPTGVLAVTEDEMTGGPREPTQIEEHTGQITT